MYSPMQATKPTEPSDVKSAILKTDTANPALQRLKSRLVAAVEPSEVITSYDRMHHRHSRS